MATTAGYPPLQASSEVADFRKSHEKRHPLAATPDLGCVATLRGASSLTAINQWARPHSPALLAKLGFTYLQRSSTATLCRIFSNRDMAALEQALTSSGRPDHRRWVP